MSPKLLRDRLRTVLLQVWDPLCVGDNSNLADEYDRYMPIFLSLLENRSNPIAIMHALENIERYELGMDSPSHGIEQAAIEIWRLNAQAD